MSSEPSERLWTVAAAFALPGRIVAIKPYGSGLINDTFLVDTDAPAKAILQRINAKVFSEPERIQANLRILLDHVRDQNNVSKSGLRLPGLVAARDGRDFHWTAERDFWRMLTFIRDTRSTEVPADLSEAREMGVALGRFHALVSDLAPDRLHDTLPGFHVTPAYLRRFDSILSSTPQGQESSALGSCLDFIERRRSIASILEDAKCAGLLQTRVIHGDPKFSNVLFDTHSGRAVSLIDLDTVKPGLIHYDLGDCLRSCCNRAGEAGDAHSVRFDLDFCRSVLHGYFSEAASILTDQDVAFLFGAIRLIPFELGLRFLTDYLEGNVYFKFIEPEENLHRAMVQFRLVESIERQEGPIRALLCR